MVGPGSLGFSADFLRTGAASFYEFASDAAPQVLPREGLPASARGGAVVGAGAHLAPDATTIVAVRFEGGVVIAGDRRATMGSMIASRDIQKVFRADEYAAVGIAGSAGIAMELVKLFQVELEHYEKIEGASLSFEGKANRLATLVRGNLSLALQGLVVVPLFVGFDVARRTGRIFSFDATGGRYEEHDFHSVGSGAVFARGSLKKLFSAAATESDAVRVVVQALGDAADDDSATGGSDLARGIYPLVSVVDANGYRPVPPETLGRIARDLAGGAA